MTMRRRDRLARGPARTVSGAVAVAVALSVATASISAGALSAAADAELPRWAWPAAEHRVVGAYVAPPHEYGPGHRGIDLDLRGDSRVSAPADGVVAFAGQVAGRGVLTLDHGDGLVTTLEPVVSLLAPGDAVRRGQLVAALDSGGHSGEGTLHFGVRRYGAYLNPLLLLGGVPRAVLLPCCE
jgi:murein DD-endopeptidase MepM/ murein hydrolase activator NlpD